MNIKACGFWKVGSSDWSFRALAATSPKCASIKAAKLTKYWQVSDNFPRFV